MDNIDLDIFNNYQQIVDRYVELYANDNKEKLETAAVIISYSLHDINMQIDAYNRNERSVSVFYQLVIKTDLLIGAVNFLYNAFLNNKNEKVAYEYKTKIEKFRLIRNLTIAHPLSTTKFEDYGFGEKNDKWCEDIYSFKPYMKYMNNGISADYVLVYKEVGKELSQKMFLTVKEYILEAVNAVLSKLDKISINLKIQIEEKVQEYRNIPIGANKELPITEYIEKLKEDVIVRYPGEVEKYQVEYCNSDLGDIDLQNINQTKIYIENSLLKKALERINLKFIDSKCTKLYNEYIKMIEDAVHNYGDSIQEMNLEISSARHNLSDVLNPSHTILSKNSTENMASYMYSKIEYIKNSDNYTMPVVLNKMKTLSSEEWKSSEKCSNLEFGMLQLWKLKAEIIPYFPIDFFNYTDKQIYMQYMAALYYANSNVLL